MSEKEEKTIKLTPIGRRMVEVARRLAEEESSEEKPTPKLSKNPKRKKRMSEENADNRQGQ